MKTENSKKVEIEVEQLHKIVDLLSKAYDELDKVKELLVEIGKEIK